HAQTLLTHSPPNCSAARGFPRSPGPAILTSPRCSCSRAYTGKELANLQPGPNTKATGSRPCPADNSESRCGCLLRASDQLHGWAQATGSATSASSASKACNLPRTSGPQLLDATVSC